MIRIRSAESITGTLDEHASLDGLPFMPEMVPYCGKRFRIAHVANNVCVHKGTTNIRRIDECVVLQMPNRCDGSAHGGCQMACQFLWKTNWLEPVVATGSDTPESHAAKDKSTNATGKASRTLVQLTQLAIEVPGSGTNGYRCQATELSRSTQPLSPIQIRQYLVHRIQNKVSLSTIGKFLFSRVIRKLLRRGDSLRGRCLGRTPVSHLNLSIGESVNVKSVGEIQSTLDARGCNRGLWFDAEEMTKLCGRQMVVSRRVERIIDEETGRLIDLKVPAVVLSETYCSGIFRRFCSRGMLFLWREAWLERPN